MKEKLLKLKEEIISKLAEVKDSKNLKDLEEKYFSRKSEFNDILKNIKDLNDDLKKEFGQLANNVKLELFKSLSEIKSKIENKENPKGDVDPTLPADKAEFGHLHPITQIRNEIESLFSSMGFMVLDGPELESDYYNFTALNFAPHHPAREMQDTFFVDIKNKDNQYDMVMRTHTSPVQIRAMKKYGAPLSAIMPGRCFRNEATDARHEHTFYQVEGIMIGENISFAHLKGVLELVGKKLYGKNTKLRMRPKYYPFVEPGSNGEYTCFLCAGKGCRVCKHTGWLEILGCGMIHPEVLKNGGIDSEKYSGFAFGFGLDRLVMLKYNIDDTRLFNSGDLRFLKQF
ncbi:phenylalanine--tRNA ligase subunit alpha [Candidatus Falkowbacteria bacterium HGW-Falkowbacteria-1]|uniref:Phenylalanine--tRNA ligase alpha subunit n=1 Tax=Candidatus Falkowbacteria bacterium HGW-Falkowbacteria-1 TaxID=2013768 RepID=A0A2N2EA47_9BACT|nr:MAG: phenylalanine--tRNA ligase subunit alpha [Candidatus Falkowbacteria bacterium HGW-Falkowbacteria-1]